MPPGPLPKALPIGGLGGMAERQVVELAPEVFVKLSGRLIALARVRPQAVPDDGGDGLRDRRVRASDVGYRSRSVGNHLRQYLIKFAGPGREGKLTAQEFVEHHAQSI